MVSLRASCVRVLAFRGLLAQPSESEELPPTRRVPAYLCPLHNFFSSRANTSSAPKDDSGDPPADHQQRAPLPVCDCSPINLALLAKSILSDDDDDPSILSFCWKTLDMLLTGLGIALVEVSDHALALFDEVQMRLYVETEERGFRITLLLEFWTQWPEEGALVLSYSTTPSSSAILIAFLRKKNSQSVDWRVPEFVSLAHYFELFVTNCF